MEKIALVVSLEFEPASKTPFLQALFEHRQRSLANEAGTLQFEVLSPGDSLSSLVLYELYESAEALKAHDEGASLALFKQQAGPFITQISVQRCAVLGA